LFGDRLLEVDHHDHAGLDGGAEERDVADPHRHAEVEAHGPLEQHASGECEGDGENDVRCLGGRVEGQVERQKNDE